MTMHRFRTQLFFFLRKYRILSTMFPEMTQLYGFQRKKWHLFNYKHFRFNTLSVFFFNVPCKLQQQSSLLTSSFLFCTARNYSLKPTCETNLSGVAVSPDIPQIQKEATLYKKSSEPFAEAKHRSRKGMKSFFVFIGLNIAAAAGATFFFKRLTDIKAEEDNRTSFNTTESILSEAEKIIAAGSTCFFMTEKSGFANIVQVLPHLPEEKVFYIPNDSKIAFFENNIITDLIFGKTSNFSLQMNFIHFSLSSNSAQANDLKIKREATLLYFSHQRNAYVILQGVVGIVKNENLRRHYWKSRWGAILPSYEDNAYLLVKFVPKRLTVHTFGCGEKHWKANAVCRQISKSGEIKWVIENQASEVNEKN